MLKQAPNGLNKIFLNPKVRFNRAELDTRRMQSLKTLSEGVNPSGSRHGGCNYELEIFFL